MQNIVFIVLFLHNCAISAMFKASGFILRPMKQYSVKCIPLSSHQRERMNEVIEQELLKAKKSVRVAIYSFTRTKMAYILAYLKYQKNLDVQVVLDKSSTIGTFNMRTFLKKLGVPSLVYNFADKLMHHKLAVIDEKTVILGSYNYSDAAAERNRESAIVLKGAALARYYGQEIDNIVQEIKDHNKKNDRTNKMLKKQWRLKMQGYQAAIETLTESISKRKK